jgi:hypothetical protein
MVHIKKVLLMMSAVFIMLALSPAVQASPVQNGDLVTVSVTIAIENPGYFWQYPFWGRQLDSIRVAGMGKSVIIPNQSSEQAVVLEVPRGYTLRVWLQFSDGISAYKEVCYEKRKISERDSDMHISLKAPEAQAVILGSSDFDEKTKNW